MVKRLPPLAGLVWRHSAFPGFRAAQRRFTPGYCSIRASGADNSVETPGTAKGGG